MRHVGDGTADSIGRARQDRPVTPVRLGPGDLTPQHRDLLTEHHDLRILRRLTAGPAGRLPVRCLVTTDSLPQNHSPAIALRVESVAPLLADAIGRLHHDQPSAGLLART